MVFNIVLAHHSSSESLAEKVVAYLESKNLNSFFSVHSITESYPTGLSQRADYVTKSQAIIALLNREFQRHSNTMDIIHFAKDSKKTIFGINTSSSYVPFGALGAIICGTKHGVLEMYTEQSISSIMNMILDSLAPSINQIEANRANQPIIDPSRIASPYIELIPSKEDGAQVLLLYHSETRQVVDLIADALTKKSIQFHLEEPQTSATTRVEKSQIVLMIMSQGFSDTYKSRATIELARQLGKTIIPISTSRAFKPTGWMGLLIAGKLFFRVMDQNQAISKQHHFFNSPMDSLTDEILISLQRKKPNYEEVEQKIIDALNLQVKECQIKLGYWPPESYSALSETNMIAKREPVIVTVVEPKLDIQFDTTNYMMLQSTQLPPQLFDSYGVPIRDNFDCMISYQWDIQDLVRQMYMNFRVRNLRCWFDIWGGMEGNVNESMATAVECSRCLLVFLTQKYLNSENCTLELKYAVYCGKAFVFILPEPGILDYLLKSTNPAHELAKELVNKHQRYEIKDADDLFNTMINNVPKFEIINHAVRAIGLAQPVYDIYNLSDQVMKLKLMLASARNEIELKLGEKRFKTCTRCNTKYEESENKIGDCKKHQAYFLGGGVLLADRWVCCNQTEQESPGCVNTTHIDVPREYVIDEDYGTGFYKPS